MTRRGDIEGIVLIAAGVLVVLFLAATGLAKIYSAGYRNGQIDAVSGSAIKFEQITLSDASTGWVNLARPQRVYRIKPKEGGQE